MTKMPTTRQRRAAAKVLRAYLSRVTRLADKAAAVQESKRIKVPGLRRAAELGRGIHDLHDFLIMDPVELLDAFEELIEHVRRTPNRVRPR